MSTNRIDDSCKIAFVGCKMEFELEAQMPMIHFQANRQGATLRASEVKPKLDKYLLDRCREQKINMEKENLDYKMQITLKEPGEVVRLEVKNKKMENGKERWKIDREKTYSIFYGNMNVAKEDQKKGLFSNPTITIICFHEQIRKLLEEHIVDFFLTTNFGTMQRKGFGSFIPKGWCKNDELSLEEKQKVARALRRVTGGACYAMTFKDISKAKKDKESMNKFCVRMSEEIKQFYSIMKSGRNHGGYIRSYIYQYGHNKLKLGNEKFWMKDKGIAPKVGKNYETDNDKTHKPKYLRALLGVGEKIEYKTCDAEGNILKNKVVSVTIKSKNVERCETPIYFKVIRNVVFIAAYPVPEGLYGQSFSFSSVKKNGKDTILNTEKSGTLSVPTKDELPNKKAFDIQDFLKSYVWYYNNKVKAKNKVSVSEVKIDG